MVSARFCDGQTTVGNTLAVSVSTLAAMKLSEVPTVRLLEILRATEAAAGVDSVEAVIIRGELIRRDQPATRRQIPVRCPDDE